MFFPFRRKNRLAVGAIVKNEGLYLLEWIAFHRVVGVDHFFLVDDNSTDGSALLLDKLSSKGLITQVPFSAPLDQPPQLLAYNFILSHFGHKSRLLAFIDADEFLVPSDSRANLFSIFAPLFDSEHIGAVAVNWASYGSSGHLNYTNDLILERFTQRSQQDFIPNLHYKSVVRPAACTTAQNPHHFALLPGYTYANVLGQPLEVVRAGISRRCIWAGCRINHYALKSLEEFERKRSRGRADTHHPDKQRELSYFRDRDKDQVSDGMNQSLLNATKREHQRLQRLLR